MPRRRQFFFARGCDLESGPRRPPSVPWSLCCCTPPKASVLRLACGSAAGASESVCADFAQGAESGAVADGEIAAEEQFGPSVPQNNTCVRARTFACAFMWRIYLCFCVVNGGLSLCFCEVNVHLHAYLLMLLCAFRCQPADEEAAEHLGGPPPVASSHEPLTPSCSWHPALPPAPPAVSP